MLGTAGRSTVRNVVGGSSKPVKADPGDEGFCPQRTGKITSAPVHSSHVI